MPGEMLALPAPPPGGLGSEGVGAIVVSTAREEPVVEEPRKAPPASVPTQTRAVGMIHPPPDIRSIVDKTSQFVARNGPEFEKRILANERHNVKFNFLNPTDPYHAYYQHQVTTIRAQLQVPSAPPGTGAATAPGAPLGAPGTTEAAPGTQDGPVVGDGKGATPQTMDLVPPEPEQYTVRLPEAIQGLDLDIIKLTAQFVARNGKSFLTGLTSREHMNPQFHFLKPTHSMFTFFTALADAYSKVLMPPKGLPDKLKRDAADRAKLLERCLQRLEWEKSQARARQQAEDAIEQERVQMALIDWHDFVVVETIEFNEEEDDELPQPMTMEEVIRRSKALAEEEAMEQEIADAQKEIAMEMDVEEMDMVQQGLRDTSLDDSRKPGGPEAGPAPPEDEDMEEEMEDEAPPLPEEPEIPIRVVRNWKRPEERATAERNLAKMVVSPITGELIDVDDMAEHIRISLIDPKYKEQKERMMAKLRETTLAPDDEIGRNIVSLARTRPDIFGTTEEEVSNAVKAEMEKKKEEVKHVVWDGHAGSIGRTATAAMAQTGTNLQLSAEEQIAQLQREKANVGPDGRPLPGASAPPGQPKLNPPPLRPLPLPPGLPNIPRPSLAPLPTPAVPLSKPPTQPPPQVPTISPPTLAPIRPPTLPPPPRPAAAAGGVPGAPPLLPRPPVPLVPQPPPPGSVPPPIPLPMPSSLAPTPPRPMGYPGMSFAPPGVLAPRPTDSMPPMPPHQMMPPPPPEDEFPPPPPEEPEPKRQKIGEDVQLFPEDLWLAQHPGSVRISVTVPSLDGEMNLNGQTVEVTTTLSETVASLKEKIAAEIGLPANKQKLSGRPGFFKDNVSLAYYNLADSDTVTLALKERGGKKK